MKRKLSQLERIRRRLHDLGWISRNDCLGLAKPPITRLAARIADLKAQGYVFRPEDTGHDEVYHLISIKDVPYLKPSDRVQMLKDNDEALEFFDNYQSEPTKV